MFKSEEQINSRLSSSKNLVNRFGGGSVVGSKDTTIPRSEGTAQDSPAIVPTVIITPLEQPGNKLGKRKLSAEDKNEIAFRSRSGETQRALAAEFKVSQSAIGEIEQGRTRVDELSVNARLDQVQDVAMDKLLASLGYIDADSLKKLDPVKLSIVAKNMSGVVSGIRRNDESGTKVTVQIYAPELKNESAYKTLDV